MNTLNYLFGALAFLSAVLGLWQWNAGRRFPLHKLAATPSFFPAISVLKPLKGCDAETRNCLLSWFKQEYEGPVQILFGVASAADPVCDVVGALIDEHPNVRAELVICPETFGANAKVSTLVQLERLSGHEVVVISDADVRVSRTLLVNLIAPLDDPKVGLVNCFYRLANPSTTAMEWEAVAVNADFWTQVLQGRDLQALDFALGAVMATRRKCLDAIGGFLKLANYLADDFELGNRIALAGAKIELAHVVVECWAHPMGWSEVWAHQLRWARTIRVCRPAPYFFSILSNGTLWPLAWLIVKPGCVSAAVFLTCLVIRSATATSNYKRLTGHSVNFWLVPVKDILQIAIWGMSFLGKKVTWRGRCYVVKASGELSEIERNVLA